MLQIVSTSENLFAPLWNCCQLPVPPPRQSLQLSNPSFQHLVYNHEAET